MSSKYRSQRNGGRRRERREQGKPPGWASGDKEKAISGLSFALACERWNTDRAFSPVRCFFFLNEKGKCKRRGSTDLQPSFWVASQPGMGVCQSDKKSFAILCVLKLGFDTNSVHARPKHLIDGAFAPRQFICLLSQKHGFCAGKERSASNIYRTPTVH